jgi:hypothetical protein
VSGTPENFKKFISAKVDYVIYKKCTISDFINGSRLKNIIMQYKGCHMGSEVLNMSIDEALFYDSKHYYHLKVPYYAEYDTKKDNDIIIKPKQQDKK